jgi:hypothetical protein
MNSIIISQLVTKEKLKIKRVTLNLQVQIQIKKKERRMILRYLSINKISKCLNLTIESKRSHFN